MPPNCADEIEARRHVRRRAARRNTSVEKIDCGAFKQHYDRCLYQCHAGSTYDPNRGYRPDQGDISPGSKSSSKIPGGDTDTVSMTTCRMSVSSGTKTTTCCQVELGDNSQSS